MGECILNVECVLGVVIRCFAYWALGEWIECGLDNADGTECGLGNEGYVRLYLDG
jgi:hypothetical protein